MKAALQARVDPSAVTVNIRPASVVISITIATESLSQQSIVATSLANNLSSVEAVSSALGIDQVESVPSIVKTTVLQPRRESELLRTASSDSAMPMVLVVVAAVAVGGFLIGMAMLYIWRRKRLVGSVRSCSTQAEEGQVQ